MKILLLFFLEVIAKWPYKPAAPPERLCNYVESLKKKAHELVRFECLEDPSVSSNRKVTLSCTGQGSALFGNVYLNPLVPKRPRVDVFRLSP